MQFQVMHFVFDCRTYTVFSAFLFFLDIDREASNLSQIAVSDMGPNLDRLWSYVCPLTKGRNVSCLAWNKSNPVS